MLFNTVNPMDDGNGMGRNSTRLDETKVRSTVFWCNLTLTQEKGLQFYQTLSHAVVLYDTPLAECVEKAVCMKTQEELHQKVRFTPRVQRVVLKSNSQYGQQDLRCQDARSSWDPSSDSKSYWETCSNTVDYRISGVPLSAVEQQDTTCENKVKRLIEKFENHKHKESFFQGFQTQKINMNNTEIFELCENSSKHSNVLTACNTYRENRHKFIAAEQGT